MAYKLIFTKNALKDIKKLDRIAKKRLKVKIENYSKAPVMNAVKLVSTSIGGYRWRVGNYRIIIDMEGNEIVVLRIRHRRDVYKM